MALLKLFHSVASGSQRKREFLTPVGLLIFGLTLAAVVVLGLFTDRVLSIPEVLPASLGASIGVVLLVLGATLCGWCVLHFRRAKGTPVPFNPPKELVVAGPYLWMRNPMVTGVFTGLFGIGLVLHSASIVFIWTPLYILAHVIELKKVEEPELELRFGTAYCEYKRRVPMFIPRPWRRGSFRAAIQGSIRVQEPHRQTEESTVTDQLRATVRWLRASYIAGAVADGLVGILMLLPDRMGEAEFRYPMGLGASLMFGWAALLLWANKKPMERKGVLVLTIFPVITGLIATMVWAAASGFFSVARVFPYVVLCVALMGLMGFSYLKAARS